MCVVGKEPAFCFSVDGTILFVAWRFVCSSVNEVQCRFCGANSSYRVVSSSDFHGGMKTKLRFLVEFQLK